MAVTCTASFVSATSYDLDLYTVFDSRAGGLGKPVELRWPEAEGTLTAAAAGCPYAFVNIGEDWTLQIELRDQGIIGRVFEPTNAPGS